MKNRITIPLWENANSVKSAKAYVAFAETDAIRFWEQQELRIQKLYNQWKLLGAQVAEMHELFADQLEENGKAEAAKEIREMAELASKSNECLRNALKEL